MSTLEESFGAAFSAFFTLRRHSMCTVPRVNCYNEAQKDQSSEVETCFS